jgi:undecaprenyl diphosphate synthase
MNGSAHTSTTQSLPDTGGNAPRHVAIIMDGNGRWAKKRHLPRVAGHARGVEAVRATVESAVHHGVKYLTLFAFSSENWRRPADEVSVLMRLFVRTLERELVQLRGNGIRLRVVGDLSRFDAKLRALIEQVEQKTAQNDRLVLTIAANYGGRWDMLQAMSRMLTEKPELAADHSRITEQELANYLAMSYAPEPDLFIRTGGEKRISNFLLWQLAYSELYFTDTFWPDFDADAFAKAVGSFEHRERRFGQTSEQLAL